MQRPVGESWAVPALMRALRTAQMQSGKDLSPTVVYTLYTETLLSGESLKRWQVIDLYWILKLYHCMIKCMSTAYYAHAVCN